MSFSMQYFLKLTLFCLNNIFKAVGDSTDTIFLNKAFLKILKKKNLVAARTYLDLIYSF